MNETHMMTEASGYAAGEGAPSVAPADGRGGREGARSHRWAHVAWVIRRCVMAAVTLIALSMIIFAATQALPGNAARQILGRAQNGAAYRAVEDRLGLNQPVVVQYADWAREILGGNLGTSVSADEPVATLLGPAIANSAVLLVTSALIAIVVATVLGVTSAARRDGWFDQAFNGYAFLFTAAPEFVVGIVLVIVFATTVFHILPAVSLIPPGTDPLATPSVFVLPVAVLVLAITPYLGRLVRGSMIDVLESEYIRMAELEGLPARRILFRHALPNALVPAIQGVAVTIGYLAGGIVVVEYVFGFPGVGTALLNAISARDIPVVQAAALLLASVYIFVNLTADVLVVYVTPRLRTADLI